MPVPLPLPDSWEAEEQHLAAVYQLAEAERAAAVAKLQSVMAQSGGTPQARSERESYNALYTCLLYTSPSPRDRQKSRMPSSA